MSDRKDAIAAELEAAGDELVAWCELANSIGPGAGNGEAERLRWEAAHDAASAIGLLPLRVGSQVQDNGGDET
jgi:hypothetical protein